MKTIYAAQIFLALTLTIQGQDISSSHKAADKAINNGIFVFLGDTIPVGRNEKIIISYNSVPIWNELAL